MRKPTVFIFLMVCVALSACGVRRELHLPGTKPDTPPPHRHMPGRSGAAGAAATGGMTLDPNGMRPFGNTPQYQPLEQ